MKLLKNIVVIICLFMLFSGFLITQSAQDRGLVAQINVSGNGQIIAVAYFTSDVRYPIDFFDTNTGEFIDSMDTAIYGFSDFALNPTGDRLIGTDGLGGLYIYDRRDNSFDIIREPSSSTSLGGLYWSPVEESLITYILGSSVQFLNIETREVIGIFNSTIGNIVDIAFSPNGDQVVSSSFAPENIVNPVASFGLEIWGTIPQSGGVISEPNLALNDIGGGRLVWSPDGERIAVLGGTGLSIFNILEENIEITNLDADIDDDNLYDLAWSPDSRYLATNGSFLRVWDIDDYSLLGEFSELATVREIVWSPDGGTIFAQNLSLSSNGLGVFEIDLLTTE